MAGLVRVVDGDPLLVFVVEAEEEVDLVTEPELVAVLSALLLFSLVRVVDPVPLPVFADDDVLTELRVPEREGVALGGAECVYSAEWTPEGVIVAVDGGDGVVVSDASAVPVLLALALADAEAEGASSNWRCGPA